MTELRWFRKIVKDARGVSHLGTVKLQYREKNEWRIDPETGKHFEEEWKDVSTFNEYS